MSTSTSRMFAVRSSKFPNAQPPLQGSVDYYSCAYLQPPWRSRTATCLPLISPPHQPGRPSQSIITAPRHRLAVGHLSAGCCCCAAADAASAAVNSLTPRILPLPSIHFLHVVCKWLARRCACVPTPPFPPASDLFARPPLHHRAYMLNEVEEECTRGLPMQRATPANNSVHR